MSVDKLRHAACCAIKLRSIPSNLTKSHLKVKDNQNFRHLAQRMFNASEEIKQVPHITDHISVTTEISNATRTGSGIIHCT